MKPGAVSSKNALQAVRKLGQVLKHCCSKENRTEPQHERASHAKNETVKEPDGMGTFLTIERL